MVFLLFNLLMVDRGSSVTTTSKPGSTTTKPKSCPVILIHGEWKNLHYDRYILSALEYILSAPKCFLPADQSISSTTLIAEGSRMKRANMLMFSTEWKACKMEQGENGCLYTRSIFIFTRSIFFSSPSQNWAKKAL